MNQTKVTHEVRVEREVGGYASAPLADVQRAVNAAVAEVKKTGDGKVTGWSVQVLEVASSQEFRFRSTVSVVARRSETKR